MNASLLTMVTYIWYFVFILHELQAAPPEPS